MAYQNDMPGIQFAIIIECVFIYNTAFGNIQCMAKALRDTQAVDTQLHELLL